MSPSSCPTAFALRRYIEAFGRDRLLMLQFERSTVESLEPDMRQLLEIAPDIDCSPWPDFHHLEG